MKQSKPTIGEYTIERLSSFDLTPELMEFFTRVAYHASEMYGNKFDWKGFDMSWCCDHYRVSVCRRNKIPVGVMIGHVGRNFFDQKITILKQDFLFTFPGNKRAASLLLRDFIDTGRACANHVIVTIATKTNIKPQSIEKLGFEKLETLYRLETSK